MRKNVALAAMLVTALVAAVIPSVTLATVVINIENAIITDTSVDQVIFMTAWATNVDGSNERLNAYTITIDGPAFTPDGVRFLVPGSTFGQAGIPTFPHPYVFKDLETVPPVENFSSTYSRLQFGATAVGVEDEVDVRPGHDGLIRIPVFVPAHARPAAYPLVVDPNATSLAGLGAPIVATPGAPGGILGPIPEPSAAALLLLPSLALLRRRRGQTSGQAA